jgi:hypothetical protein
MQTWNVYYPDMNEEFEYMAVTGITPRIQYVYETSILVAPDEAGTYFFTKIAANANIITFQVGDITNTAPDEGEDFLQAPVRGIGHKRRYGIQTRFCRITRITGASPNQGRIYRIIPLLSNATYEGIVAQIYSNPTITYESQTDWKLAGIEAESYGIS